MVALILVVSSKVRLNIGSLTSGVIATGKLARERFDSFVSSVMHLKVRCITGNVATIRFGTKEVFTTASSRIQVSVISQVTFKVLLSIRLVWTSIICTWLDVNAFPRWISHHADFLTFLLWFVSVPLWYCSNRFLFFAINYRRWSFQWYILHCLWFNIYLFRVFWWRAQGNHGHRVMLSNGRR